MDNHTKKSTRIIIWVIAIVMALGFLGSYFLVILENNNAKNPTTSQTKQPTQELPVDPNAYKVTGKVESLQKIDVTVGEGDEVKPGDSVKVHYKGTIAQTGAKFDSSYDRGEPIELSLAQVIPGWQEGIPGMKVGGKRRLVIPAAMAYGDKAQSGIPANSDLVFEVELIAITPAAAQ
jgi:peptidylprolyl isomerase